MIYLDHSATTPLNPEVLESMLPIFSTNFGNPSGAHQLSRKAASLISKSRATVAKTLSCKPSEIIFTSCGTESNNLAIRGVADYSFHKNRGRHLITSATDHPSVVKTMEEICVNQDFKYTQLTIDDKGFVDPQVLEQSIRKDTVLISITYASNEVGTIQPIQELAKVAKEHQILFHIDAVQGGNFLNLNVNDLSVDMLSLSGHKIYGPKGVGILYVREGTLFNPQLTGGSQESNKRAGTENVAGVVGFAKALEMTRQIREEESNRLKQLADTFIEKIIQVIPDVSLTGDAVHRIPGHVSLIIKGIEADVLLMHLDMEGICASSGSACSTGNPEPSPTLLAMGYSRQGAKGALRFSMGMATTWEELDCVINTLNRVVLKLRS